MAYVIAVGTVDYIAKRDGGFILSDAVEALRYESEEEAERWAEHFRRSWVGIDHRVAVEPDPLITLEEAIAAQPRDSRRLPGWVRRVLGSLGL
jgi:hypothetical protein